jgi:DNA-binding NarL/FixJ family response regulator
MFVRSLTADERQHLEAGLRSPNRFPIRRCQILLASSRGERVSAIARSLGYATQTCRNVIRDFHSRGSDSLTEKSPARRPCNLSLMMPNANN